MQLRQPGAQLLDLVVTAQPDQGRGQLVAAVQQFTAPLIGTPRRGQVSDLRRRQCGSQILLRRSVFRLNVECGRARSEPRGQDAGNLDLGGAARGGRPALAGGQRHPLVTDDEFDVGGRDEFDRRRHQRELALGPFDGCGGSLDLLEKIVGQRNCR